MSTVVCIIIVATIMLNLIPAIYLIDWFVVWEHLNHLWQSPEQWSWWEKLAKTLYDDVVCGVFGGDLFVSLFCIGICIISIIVCTVFAIRGIARKQKRSAIYFSASVVISIVEILLLIKVLIALFMSV